MVSLSTDLELEVQCYRLRNRDALSKSDPYVVLFVSTPSQSPTELGRTETANNDLAPHFTRRIPAKYFFEESQSITVRVFDHDQAKKDDPLGVAETTLGRIVSNAGQLLDLQKKIGKAGETGSPNIGQVLLTPHQLGAPRTVINFKVRGQGLDKADLLGKSDPFFILEQARNAEAAIYAPLYKSEVIKKNLNPVWKDAMAKLDSTTGKEPLLRFSVYDEDKHSPPDFIGLTEPFTPGQLANGGTMDIINTKKASRSRKYKNSGKLVFDYWTPGILPSFYEYVTGALSLNFSIAVDFTASNGAPTDRRSLHYMDPMAPNQYLRALRSVGLVLQDYSKDQRWPALGFGGELPGTHGASFNFHLNGQADPTCYGLGGVEAAYMHSIQTVRLSGPTYFAPLIRDVTQRTASWQLSEANQFYNILTILTDGAISDMAETKRAIVDASQHPLSIIIVGIGDADFKAMDELDSDNTALCDDTGRAAVRDIVQFVPFRDFERGQPGRFASAVLAELPDKVAEYLHSRGIRPQAQVRHPEPGPAAVPVMPG